MIIYGFCQKCQHRCYFYFAVVLDFVIGVGIAVIVFIVIVVVFNVVFVVVYDINDKLKTKKLIFK